MKVLERLTVLGNYIDGHFSLPSEPDGKLRIINPGNLEDEVGVFPYSTNHVYEAIDAASRASLSWASLSVEERASHFKRFYAEIESHQEQIAEIISREVGKPLWESRQEARGLLGKIDITLKEGLDLISEKKVLDAQPGILGRYRFKPKGVMLVLGPFNFPAHLPHGHIVPALLTGNTVIFKPSEKTPGTGQLMAEMIHRSGFPPGVFNLVQGEREVGKRLALGNVDGVLFTGSYDVGLKIKKETLSHFWKTLALEMGGKNASIIVDDCDLEKALFENLMGAFQTTGQRCSATSRIIVFESILDRFLKRFHEAAKTFKIGYAFDEPQSFMGPLISQDAVENYLRFQGIAEREGGELIMRGRELDRTPPGYYVSPSIYLMEPSEETRVYLSTEIFGPTVALIRVKNIEEAIWEANKSDFGLAISVFTKNREIYEQVYQKTKVGIVNWNRSTAGGSSRLPFGGQGKSGNQQPTALFAPYYCTYPVSSLEDEAPFNSKQSPPGLHFPSP